MQHTTESKQRGGWLMVLLGLALLTALIVYQFQRPTVVTDLSTLTPDQRQELAEEHHYIYQDLISWNKIVKARAHTEELLVRYPTDPQLHYLLAQICLAEDQTKAAYDFLRQAVVLDPTRDDFHFSAGHLAYQLKLIGKARSYYMHAIQLSPSNAKYRIYFGQLLYSQKEYDAAEVQLMTAIQLNAKAVAAYGMLAELYSVRQETGRAMDYVNKAISYLREKDHRSVSPDEQSDQERLLKWRLFKASLLARLERFNQSLSVVFALPPQERQSEPAVEQLAAIYHQMGQEEKAAKVWLPRWYASDQQDVRAAAEAGIHFFNAGKLSEAIDFYQKARSVNADHALVQQLAQLIGQ